MTSDRERWISAIHESGHAVIAIALGRLVHFASIKPTEHYSGVVSHGGPRRLPNQLKVPPSGMPAFLWPAPLRRTFECNIAISLAGPVAEEELANVGRPRGEHVREDYRHARAATSRLAQMSPRETSLLRETEELGPLTPDLENVRQLASIISGDQATAHTHYLKAVTRALVHKHRDEIETVAEALHARELLSGRAIKQLVKGEK